MISLSEGQGVAFDKVMHWFEKGDALTMALAGYAGTGKSTLAKLIDESIGGGAIFCALTGKAAMVLREKGNAAATIHSLLYRIVGKEEIEKVENEIVFYTNRGDFAKVDELNEKLAELRLSAKKPKFALNPSEDLKRAPLVIVDEYSMLPDRIRKDLESVAQKVLYMGDPFQLPPVNAECSIKPDVFLTEIHRQALDSPIVRYATEVREGRTLSFVDAIEGEEGFAYAPQEMVAPEKYMKAEQIIVGFNKTRTGWNNRFRERRGIPLTTDGVTTLPQPGERVICLKNNAEEGLFNGMTGYAADSHPKNERRFTLDFEADGEKFRALNVWTGDIQGREKEWNAYDRGLQALERFDFAYAITCHKSQGSEFESVLIYNEPVGREEIDRRKWLYTAITRAKKNVLLVEPKR